MSHINIVFNADTSYYQHLCVSLVSLLENNPNHSFSIFVMVDKIDVANIATFQKLKKQYNHFEIFFKKVTNTELHYFQHSVLTHVPLRAYCKCLIPNLFQEINRVIYIDCDTIIVGDIGELWNIDMKGYCLAAAACPYTMTTNPVRNLLGWEKGELYVNSGVLLMDIKLMREQRIVDLFITTAIQTERLLAYGDQEIINKALRGKIKEIDNRFNWCTWESIKSQKESIQHPSIVISHFTQSTKPWSTNGNCQHESCNMYFKYLAKTPYRYFIYRYRIMKFFRTSCINPSKQIIKTILPKSAWNLFKFIFSKNISK